MRCWPSVILFFAFVCNICVNSCANGFVHDCANARVLNVPCLCSCIVLLEFIDYNFYTDHEKWRRALCNIFLFVNKLLRFILLTVTTGSLIVNVTLCSWQKCSCFNLLFLYESEVIGTIFIIIFCRLNIPSSFSRHTEEICFFL